MTDRIGQQLGNYRLVRLIGQGGFADVYLGEHIHLGTKAAIKVLSMRLTSDNVEHFRDEARTVAGLVHPRIVRVLDFGIEDATSTPYLIMDYAPNGTLRQRYPRGAHLPLPQVVSYVKQVAEALHYAHERRLIHRDVKPENMLLGANDDVLLSDFGIALVAHSTRYQNTQEVIGTAAYMAPEQLQGKPRRASDQYALGIVVYEWLTGDRPFRGSFTEIYSQQMFVSPPPLRERSPEVPPTVQEVVFTALAKDPERRFGSVLAFANALEQATQISPLRPAAFPPGFSPSAQLFLPTEIVGAISPNPSSPPTNVDTPAIRSSEPTIVATPSSPRGVPSSPIRVSTPFGEPQSAKRGLSRRAVVAGLVGLAVVGGGVTWAVLSYLRGNSLPASIATPTSVSRSVATPLGTTLNIYHGHAASVGAVAWSLPDGQRIASGSGDRTVQVWDATSGGNVLTYRGHSGSVQSLTWSPDGTRIASGGDDQTVQVWDAASGNPIYTYSGHSDTVWAVAWSPGGRYIASASGDRTVQVWEASSGSPVYTYHGHSDFVYAVAWSPDSTRIASGGGDQTVQVWDAADGGHAFTYRGHAGSVNAVAWSPDGKRIASSKDTTVHIWNPNSGNDIVVLQRHFEPVTAVSWSYDGTHIVSGSTDRTARVWDTSSGKTTFIYRGHSQKVWNVAWSPPGAGNRVASASEDRTVQVWQAL
jgi:WD40 repeat protein